MKLVLVPALVSLALLLPASAEDCVPTTSQADLTLPTGIGTYYVDDAISCSEYTLEACQVRVCTYVVGGDECLIESGGYSFWVYEETNGIDGLQRRDVIDDTCSLLIPPDTAHY